MRLSNFLGTLPHCTGPCNGGRKTCSCSTGLRPITTPKRTSWLSRLAAWWHNGKLRAELAGLDSEEATLRERLESLEALAFAPPEVAKEGRMQVQLHRIGLAHVLERRKQLQAELQAAKGRP